MLKPLSVFQKQEGTDNQIRVFSAFVNVHNVNVKPSIFEVIDRLNTNIYIFIAIALYESVILNVLQFPMQNIYQSCDLGHVIGRSNVNASQ